MRLAILPRLQREGPATATELAESVEGARDVRLLRYVLPEPAQA